MTYKIALLFKEHYKDYFLQQLRTQNENVSLHFFSYQTLEELIELFKQNKQNFDGFIVSGIFPLQALTLSGLIDAHTLIEICPIDIENTYKILLQQLISNKNLKLSRIGMDFLEDEHNLEDLIRNNQFSACVHKHENRWKTFTSLSDLIKEEHHVTELYQKLYQEQKIDLIITYFYSALDNMKSCGIRCYYVYPSADMFQNIVESLKKSISLRELQYTLSAAIHIDMEDLYKSGNASFEQYNLEINRIIMDFNKQNYNKLILKDSYNSFEIYTDYSVLKRLTKDFTECPLWEPLHTTLNYNSSIGYGLGTSLYQARINAIDACSYGKGSMIKPSGNSFLIDEKEMLCSLSAEQYTTGFQIPEDYVHQAANQAKLSSESIVRIIGVMNALNTNEITSHDLVTHLNLSLRSANKLLSALEKAGYAKISAQKRRGNKGRPINIYRILLEYT